MRTAPGLRRDRGLGSEPVEVGGAAVRQSQTVRKEPPTMESPRCTCTSLSFRDRGLGKDDPGVRLPDNAEEKMLGLSGR